MFCHEIFIVQSNAAFPILLPILFPSFLGFLHFPLGKTVIFLFPLPLSPTRLFPLEPESESVSLSMSTPGGRLGKYSCVNIPLSYQHYLQVTSFYILSNYLAQHCFLLLCYLSPPHWVSSWSDTFILGFSAIRVAIPMDKLLYLDFFGLLPRSLASSLMNSL